MSYYPILNAPYCSGKTVLYNFSPNNWEPSYKGKQYVNLTYIQDGSWRSFVLDELNYQAFKTIYHEDVISLIPEGGMPFLSLSRTKLPKKSKKLPVVDCNHTVTPEYRATLGLKSNYTETSYFGIEYKPNGNFSGSNRPHINKQYKREFFAEVTMKDDKIVSVK